MGLKITIEVDGQTEQQLAPMLNQWMVRGSLPLRHENPVHLQGQIQQLMAENTHLQAQLSHRQKRLVANVPRAIAPASQPVQPVEVSAVQPPLPNQYHPHRRTIVRRWFNRQVGGLVSGLLGKRRFLIVLFIAAGTVALAPQMAELLWPPPEYAGDSEGGPGVVSETKPHPEEAPVETVTEPPPGPASKAGSKPPPPPAFQ